MGSIPIGRPIEKPPSHIRDGGFSIDETSGDDQNPEMPLVTVTRLSAVNAQCEIIRHELWKRHKEWTPETIERLSQELGRIERVVLRRNGKVRPLKRRERR